MNPAELLSSEKMAELLNEMSQKYEQVIIDSPPVLVDNTPPVFKTLGVQGRRLRAEVVDGLGPIARVEAAVDGSAVSAIVAIIGCCFGGWL